MPTTNHNGGAKKIKRPWLLPSIVLVVLAAITFLVWRQQLRYQSSLLSRHTEDICFQASRRLQIFVESHLKMANVFARRWSTHENRDFSRQRFDEFASVLVQELPGYHMVGLVSTDMKDFWSVPKATHPPEVFLDSKHAPLLKQAEREGQPILSEPFKFQDDKTCFYAALPLVREESLLGYLIVDFHAETLIDECFHTRIQSEFDFVVKDGQSVLFESSDDAKMADFTNAAVSSNLEFEVRNRSWQLTMMPKKNPSGAASWTASISVPIMGLLLSVGLSWLTYLLSRRMEMYRAARDTALTEIEERLKAEAARASSESRYQNVFDSATDGLLVLETDGTIAEANVAAGAIHGYGSGEMVGKPVEDLIAPDFRHKYKEFKRQLDQKGSARLASVDVRKDGSLVDIEVRGTQMMDGEELKYLAIITDVSERKLAMERHAVLSRKAIAAQEEERARLSMELHDELGQLLTAIRLEMGWLRKQVSAEPLVGGDIFQNTISLSEKATDELRRICKGLRPPLLDDLGLEPAVRQLVSEFQERSGINIDLVFQLDEREKAVSKETAICAYRILQESLNNALKHSKADTIDISITKDGESLELSVYDNGTGFEMTKLKSHQGYGLDGMTERANLVNGTLEIRSVKNQGTRVVFRVPLVH